MRPGLSAINSTSAKFFVPGETGEVSYASTAAVLTPARKSRRFIAVPLNFFISRRVPFNSMLNFLLWCILLVVCWPVALAVLVLYPIVWLLLLPFRIVGVAVEGVLELLWSIITLPAHAVRRMT